MAHEVELDDFRIANTPVRCGEFAAFLVADAYKTRSLWNRDGWNWRRRAKMKGPLYWQKRDGQWHEQHFGAWRASRNRQDTACSAHNRHQVRRFPARSQHMECICREAKVPVVTAHGMRGLHATLATQAGATAGLVAGALGHESTTTTRDHYIDRRATDQAKQERALRLISGGKH